MELFSYDEIKSAFDSLLQGKLRNKRKSYALEYVGHKVNGENVSLVTNRQNVLPDGDRINDLVKVSFSTPDKTLADYYEKVSGIYKGVPFGYEENFQLKFWTPKEVTGFLTTNLGFELVNTLNATNATYFLFQKK